MIPGGWELVLVVVVLVLLFGAKKLPDMARSVGQSARVFKGEMKGMKADEQPTEAEKPDETPPALPPATQQAPPEQTATTPPGSETSR